jgi:hypothetical protein
MPGVTDFASCGAGPLSPSASAAAPSVLDKAGDDLSRIIHALSDVKDFFSNFRNPETAIDNGTQWLAAQLGNNGQPGCGTGADNLADMVHAGIQGSGNFASAATISASHLGGPKSSFGGVVHDFLSSTFYAQTFRYTATAALIVAGLVGMVFLVRVAFKRENTHVGSVEALMRIAAVAALFAPVNPTDVTSCFAYQVMERLVQVSGQLGVSGFASMVGQDTDAAFAVIGHVIGTVAATLAGATVTGLVAHKIPGLDHLHIIAMTVKLLLFIFLANFLYLIFVLVLRHVVVAFVFGTAALVLPIWVVFGKTALTEAWKGLFVGAMLAPIIFGICLGITFAIADNLIGGTAALNPLTFFLVLLLLSAGTYLTHNLVQQLTFGHFNRPGRGLLMEMGAAGALGGAVGAAVGYGWRGGGRSRGDEPPPAGGYRPSAGQAAAGALGIEGGVSSRSLSHSLSPVLRFVGATMGVGNSMDYRIRESAWRGIEGTALGGLPAALRHLRQTRSLQGVGAAFGGGYDAHLHHTDVIARNAAPPSMLERDARVGARTAQWLLTSDQGHQLLEEATAGQSFAAGDWEGRFHTMISEPAYEPLLAGLAEYVGEGSIRAHGREDVPLPPMSRYRLDDALFEAAKLRFAEARDARDPDMPRRDVRPRAPESGGRPMPAASDSQGRLRRHDFWRP